MVKHKKDKGGTKEYSAILMAVHIRITLAMKQAGNDPKIMLKLAPA